MRPDDLQSIAGQPVVVTPPHAPPVAVQAADSQRHFLAVFFLSFMWGIFGVDRFYLGKVGTGVVKLLTFGGFGIWALIDVVLIMSGAMRDVHGREMREYARYKKFAARTVLLFAVATGLLLLVVGSTILYVMYYFMTEYMQGGGFDIGLPTEVTTPESFQI